MKKPLLLSFLILISANALTDEVDIDNYYPEDYLAVFYDSYVECLYYIENDLGIDIETELDGLSHTMKYDRRLD